MIELDCCRNGVEIAQMERIIHYMSEYQLFFNTKIASLRKRALARLCSHRDSFIDMFDMVHQLHGYHAAFCSLNIGKCFLYCFAPLICIRVNR